jgi:hypothetical protein
MATKKARNPRYVSDTGIAIFPYLIEPDTEYNADGEYKVKLRLSPDAELYDNKRKSLGSIQEFLDEMLEKSVEKAKQDNPKVKKIKEADAPYTFDDDNGDLLVNFKLKASGTTRDGKPFTQAPALFDAKGKPFDGEEIWGGSKIKVSFEVVPFYTKLIGAGITLRLKAAQIIELRQGGGASAENYGFGEEEGYEAEDETADSGFASEEDDVPAGDDDDQDGDF